MSSALIKAELRGELEKLDQRYSSSEQALVSKKRQHFKTKGKRRYKINPKVEEIAKNLQVSASARKKLEKEAIARNAQKLLDLAAQSGSNKAHLSAIIEQNDSSKRLYEPKGRQLLKPKTANKPKNKAQPSIFSESDFEEFRKSYFANSAQISQKSKRVQE